MDLNFLSLILPGQQQQQLFSYLNDDIRTAVTLEESEKLCNTLITKLTELWQQLQLLRHRSRYYRLVTCRT